MTISGSKPNGVLCLKCVDRVKECRLDFDKMARNPLNPDMAIVECTEFKQDERE